jgi:hypothetical protein
VAAAVGPGPAEVSLYAPPPLDRPLTVSREEADVVTVSDGDTLVARGFPATVDVDPPPGISIEAAAAASTAGFDTWVESHPFPRCVVCGPDRGPGDGLEVFPGRVGKTAAFAATWTPGADTGDEMIWAALDCPTSAPVANFGNGPAIVLARLTAAIEGEVHSGETYALLSWPLGIEGRKHHSAVALYDAEGTVVARAEALWIALKEG